MSGSSSPKSKPKRPSPFPLRLSDAEKSELLARAGNIALGAYIKSQLFADGPKRIRHANRSPVQDRTSLSQVLAMLGQSKVGDRLDRLVQAVESGALVLDDDTVTVIQSACTEVHAMRMMLMKALGFQVDEAELPETLRQTFTQAAASED
ncbi:hypothetical protein [uncultured Roseibium sp.]|uniref:hypothetical protein n=1 Tax=uncultured Roseibium sp. TaxID=1936171 RepID=UPI00260CA06E|nr:hypothetical protein [uncultured Roseibium sp.]